MKPFLVSVLVTLLVITVAVTAPLPRQTLSGILSRFKKDYVALPEANKDTRSKRAIRVKKFDRFVANAFLLAKNVVLTNKHVCDIPDFTLVNGRNEEAVPTQIILSTEFDVCIVKLEEVAAETFSQGLTPLKIKNKKLRLNAEAVIYGYTYRFMGDVLFILAESTGRVLEYIKFPVEAEANEDLGSKYFNNTVATNLPIVPGCSGSPIYYPSSFSSEEILAGIANARGSDGVGIFVPATNILLFIEATGLLTEGVDYVRVN